MALDVANAIVPIFPHTLQEKNGHANLTLVTENQYSVRNDATGLGIFTYADNGIPLVALPHYALLADVDPTAIHNKISAQGGYGDWNPTKIRPLISSDINLRFTHTAFPGETKVVPGKRVQSDNTADPLELSIDFCYVEANAYGFYGVVQRPDDVTEWRGSSLLLGNFNSLLDLNFTLPNSLAFFTSQPFIDAVTAFITSNPVFASLDHLTIRSHRGSLGYISTTFGASTYTFTPLDNMIVAEFQAQGGGTIYGFAFIPTFDPLLGQPMILRRQSYATQITETDRTLCQLKSMGYTRISGFRRWTL